MMNLIYPNFNINFKIYPGTSGRGGLKYTKMIERVGDETGIRFTVTSQIPDIRLIAEETSLQVIAPHVDAVKPGRGMGHILPEAVKEAGAMGVVINHVEHRDSISDIVFKIKRCREIGLDSLICVDSIEMGKMIALLTPDCIIFELPRDIATIRAITKTHYALAKEFIKIIKVVNPEIKISLGGGISTPQDVRLAFELGTDCTGCASAFFRAKDKYKFLKEIAKEVPKSVI